MSTAELILASTNAFLTLLLTGALGFVGISYRRERRLKIAEERLHDLRALWAATALASPMRIDDPVRQGAAEPLSPSEAAALDRALADWYYERGHGITLSGETQRMYLHLREGLRSFARSTET